MQDFRANEAETVLGQVRRSDVSHAAHVGLDVHKDTIAVAVAPAGRESPTSLGEIANQPKAIGKLADDLVGRYGGEVIQFCYEAGPCGYEVYRQLTGMGFDCEVVAPSRIPKAPGERIKTDRRDARKLARLSRAGELTPVWVPDEEQEAMRDLVRARADFKNAERRARQQLGAFLLRHGRHWSRGRWTKAHFAWLDEQRFERDWREWAFREYLDAVRAAGDRVAALTKQLHEALAGWSMAPVVRSLIALRGVDVITAMTLLSELGDVGRFDKPGQLMAYLGLVPSEHSSGGAPPAGRDHPDRQPPGAARAGGIGVVLPVSGAAHGLSRAQGGRCVGGGQGDRLEGPAPLVRTLPASADGRQEQQAGERRRGPRVVGLRLGHRAPRDAPDPTVRGPRQ